MKTAQADMWLSVYLKCVCLCVNQLLVDWLSCQGKKCVTTSKGKEHFDHLTVPSDEVDKSSESSGAQHRS